MKKSLTALIVLMMPALGFALDYTLETDYCFMHKKNRIFVDGYFTANFSEDFDKHGFKEKKNRIFVDGYFTANFSEDFDKHGFKETDLNYFKGSGLE